MDTLVITVHVIACLAVVGLVMIQSGAEGMGVMFGGSSSSLFGSTGAGGLLSKLTIGAAAVFFATSLLFTAMNRPETVSSRESVILDEPAPPTAPEAAPNTPTLPSPADGGAQSAPDTVENSGQNQTR